MKQVVSAIFLFVIIVVVNAQIAKDVKEANQKIKAYVCVNPGYNQIPDTTFFKFVQCYNSVQQVTNCQKSSYGFVYNTKVTLAKVCKPSVAAQDALYSQCLSAILDVNTKLRNIQVCEKAALNIQ